MQKLPFLLASALLMCGSLQLRADEVKLTTALPVGEDLVLALNADLSATLTWGNGDTQEVTSDGTLLTLPVKDTKLTITSTTGKIISLYAQGDALTAIDLSQAANLKELFAADNQLSSLDLSKCTALVRLDVQGNKLASLVLSSQKDLQELNVADNGLSATLLKVNASAPLTHFVAAGNKLSSLPSGMSTQDLKALWVQDNTLKTLSLGQSTKLHTLLAMNNGLTSLTLAKVPQLTDLWVSNNSLKTLNLANGAASLTTLAADHNALTTLTWNEDGHSSLKDVYLNDNALFISSMPSVTSGSNKINVVYEPQSGYALTDYCDLDKAYDWRQLISYDGWGKLTKADYTLVDGSGYTLVKRTDFKESGMKFTFTTKHVDVVLTVTSSDYTFKTKPFNIGIRTGISEITTGQGTAEINTSAGRLSLTLAAAAHISIYNASGTAVVNTSLPAGTHTWSLPTGVYIVNGQKVLIP